jgi:neutral ceramidase
MGYAKTGQDTQGIHFRLYSRAVIVEDSNGNRACFVTCDIAMISQIIKLEVFQFIIYYKLIAKFA